MTDVSVVIPWRSSGNPEREANLTRVLDHLAELEVPLILADDRRTEGPFNRSAAYNHGRELSPSDAYIWNEADMLCPLDQLDDGIAVAMNRPGLCVPFTTYRYLGREASRLALSGMNVDTLFPDWRMENGTSVGAIGICSEESMQQVGGWDETLAGHGYDDNAMWAAFRIGCGPATFIEGDATHLYHPMAYAPWERGSAAADMRNFSPEEVTATMRNRERVREYERCITPEQVRELTSGAR